MSHYVTGGEYHGAISCNASALGYFSSTCQCNAAALQLWLCSTVNRSKGVLGALGRVGHCLMWMFESILSGSGMAWAVECLALSGKGFVCRLRQLQRLLERLRVSWKAGQAEWSRVEVKRAFVEAWQPESAMVPSLWSSGVSSVSVVRVPKSFRPMQAITLEWSGLIIEQKARFSEAWWSLYCSIGESWWPGVRSHTLSSGVLVEAVQACRSHCFQEVNLEESAKGTCKF